MAEFNLPQLIGCVPPRWFPTVDENSSILYSAYRCLLPPAKQFAAGPHLDLGDAVVGFLWGEAWHLSGDDKLVISTGPDGALQLSAPPSGGIQKSATGAWVLVIQPLSTGSAQTSQTVEQARLRRHEISAVLCATMGHLLVFDLEFENTAWLQKTDLSRDAAGIEVKREFFISPLLSQERLDSASKLDAKVRALSDVERPRLSNALMWYDLGSRTQGTQRFINLWVALEALVLRESSNIGPLKESVARAYKISAGSASHKFGLGRLLRLRSLILHGQARIAPGIGLSSFLAALFVDVAHESLGLTCERRAEEALAGPDYDRSEFIDAATAELMKT